MWNKNFIDLLNSEFEKLKARNPRISMRGFARILGVSPSTVFRLASGTLTISSERALEMLEKLSIEPDRLNELIFLMNHPYKTTVQENLNVGEFIFEGNKEDMDTYRNELYGLLLRLSRLNPSKPHNARLVLSVEIIEELRSTQREKSIS